MKFEEILPAYRNGEIVEYLDKYTGDWSKIPSEDLFLLCGIEADLILKGEFRIKPKKVKRYQILYTDSHGKNFYLTSKDEKWTKEEFKRNFDIACYKRVFHSIIEESEEEFDE